MSRAEFFLLVMRAPESSRVSRNSYSRRRLSPKSTCSATLVREDLCAPREDRAALSESGG